MTWGLFKETCPCCRKVCFNVNHQDPIGNDIHYDAYCEITSNNPEEEIRYFQVKLRPFLRHPAQGPIRLFHSNNKFEVRTDVTSRRCKTLIVVTSLDSSKLVVDRDTLHDFDIEELRSHFYFSSLRYNRDFHCLPIVDSSFECCIYDHHFVFPPNQYPKHYVYFFVIDKIQYAITKEEILDAYCSLFLIQ